MDPVLFVLAFIGFFAGLVIVGLWMAVRDLRRHTTQQGSVAPERNDPFKW